MSPEQEALAKVLKLKLNPRQAFARAQILKGSDYNYTVQGGPGSGKSLLLAHVAHALENLHPGTTQILSIQRGPANAYRNLGLNATSVASFVAMPELDDSTEPSPAFLRRIAKCPRKNSPLFLLWDEYAFATAANVALVLNCVQKITTGRLQFLAFGDVGQLEPPSGGSPAICHPIFNDKRRMRACILTDMTPRFKDPELLYVVQQLRDYSKPISARAETILENRSLTTTMWRHSQPETTLCLTNASVRDLNRRQWLRADKHNRATVTSVAGKKAELPRPPDVHLVYNRKIVFTRPYIPSPTEKESRYIANGEMATLLSGPSGVVRADPDTTFVVEFEEDGAVPVMCKFITAGEYAHYCMPPFQSAAGLTMAKIQGLTLQNITVDMTGCGRVSAMVAISRGCQFDNWDGNGGVRIVNYEPGSADDMSAISPPVLAATIAFAKMETM